MTLAAGIRDRGETPRPSRPLEFSDRRRHMEDYQHRRADLQEATPPRRQQIMGRGESFPGNGEGQKAEDKGESGPAGGRYGKSRRRLVRMLSCICCGAFAISQELPVASFPDRLTGT